MAELKAIKEEGKSIRPYVVIAQPRRDLKEVPAQNFEGFSDVSIDLWGYSHGYVKMAGQKVDVARNYLIDQVLETGAKYLLFAGDDTVLPYDAFLKLHETAEKNPDAMVVGVYYLKLSSPMIFVRNNDYLVPANVDPGQVFEAYQTGLDAALIPTSILRKMKEEDPEIPYCCIAANVKDIPYVGEDEFFAHRLRKLGYRTLVNTDVQCLHMDTASGKYTAHPSIDVKNYKTLVPITTRLEWSDKEYLDKRYSRPLGATV